MQNFIDAVRANDPKILTCDILEGHLSAALPHLANISYRVGHQLRFDPKAERFEDDKKADALLIRDGGYRKGFEIPEVVHLEINSEPPVPTPKSGLCEDNSALGVGGRAAGSSSHHFFPLGVCGDQLLVEPQRLPRDAGPGKLPLDADAAPSPPSTGASAGIVEQHVDRRRQIA